MRNQALYLLPNIFTAASTYIGVLSIIYSIKGDLSLAGWLIVIAAVFDGLDGRIARATGTTSRFGMEFDSLSDAISFGVAPAILLFCSFGEEYGKFGVLVSALFVVFGAVRLARFNVTTVSEPNVFIGVPIPAAAVFVVSWVLFLHNYKIPLLEPVMLFFILLVAFLMVSNVRYPSFKKLGELKQNLKKLLIIIISILSLIYLFPSEALAFLSTVFIISGVVRALYFLIKKRKHLQNID
ncbi:MAG: CDP-diacylglycerol--serine O-phosphatidyltransferase [Campylobacterales bacterium]